MGLFTTVIHEGKEIQFCTDEDECRVYNLGDEDPLLPDGVYDGYCLSEENEEYRPWIVIKNHTIHAIVDPFDDDDDGPGENLWIKYGIDDPGNVSSGIFLGEVPNIFTGKAEMMLAPLRNLPSYAEVMRDCLKVENLSILEIMSGDDEHDCN